MNTKKFVRTFFSSQLSSFTYLNITQFLGALNDNIYKLLTIFFLIKELGIGMSHIILSSTGAVFVLPFLLFSSNSGTLADRFSKRNIIVFTKILELLVMSFGLLSFAFESIGGSYVTLFLMATHSALFSPSKYGIIPEIVQADRISNANGLMTSFTFLAIIVGTFLASFITEITNHNFILAALFCTLVSLAGVLTSFGIEYTPPAGSNKKLSPLVVHEVFRTLKAAWKVSSLVPCMAGSAFFLFMASFVQMNIIPYAVKSLGLSDVQGGYLFLLTALGIGTGSVIAGRISGRMVELGIVPVAAVGIVICMFLLAFFNSSLVLAIIVLIVVGMLGGLYEIPLDSYIQISSESSMRGQVVATTNFLCFIGVLLTSALIYILTAVFGLNAHQGFAVMGVIAFFVALFFFINFIDHVSRFVGMLLCRLIFKADFQGLENISLEPSLFITHPRNLKEIFLLYAMQRYPLRFFIDEKLVQKKWKRRVGRLLRVQWFNIERLDLQAVKDLLAQNSSVCFLVRQSNEEAVIAQLNRDELSFHPIQIQLEESGRIYKKIPAIVHVKS